MCAYFKNLFEQKVDEETFKNNIKLRDLDLSQNRLDGNFDLNTLKHLSNLQTLNLAGTGENELFESKIPLQWNSSTFTIAGNRITAMKNFSREHAKMNLTTFLQMSHNKLDSFPVELVQERPYLKQLLLNHNKIPSIPGGALHENQDLIEIDLSHNRLTTLAITTFENNPKLETLWLDHNGLTSLEEGLLHKNTDLRIFSANGNKITYISPTFFLFNIHLEEIHLSDNMIAMVPKGLFAPIGESLRLLTMSKNSLESLPYDSFEANTNLESLYLHGNSLRLSSSEETASRCAQKESEQDQNPVSQPSKYTNQ